MDGISRLGWAAVFNDISDMFRVEPVRIFIIAGAPQRVQCSRKRGMCCERTIFSPLKQCSVVKDSVKDTCVDNCLL